MMNFDLHGRELFINHAGVPNYRRNSDQTISQIVVRTAARTAISPMPWRRYPRNPPWVHASGAAWLSLPDGGRVRTSPHGNVYVSNSGEEGYGYAVCLQCGRTAAEKEPQAAMRPLPPELNERGGHRPLRGAPRDEQGFCLGSAGSFSIKRNLEHGHSVRTAVVEVQLYDCRDADTARAVAVALREACAIELGIEPDEMGFAATPALTPGRAESWCAVVYDRASGGAGFASTIAEEPIRCLKTARDLLDCAAPGGCGEPEAERFCSRCLLSADTQHMIERCNRHTAFQVLDELIPRLEIAAEDRLFGGKTELESTPLANALTRRIAQAPSRMIVLWLHGDPQNWELDEWPAKALVETWGLRQVPIRFVVRADAIRSADITTRQSLARLVQRAHTAELVEWIDGVIAATPLAAHHGDSASLVWASRDRLAGEPGAEWGRSSTAPVVRGPVDGPVFGKSIDLSELLTPSPETAIVEIAGDANGTAVGFGMRLRRAFELQSADLLRRASDGKLVEVVYTDRYVFSPLSALLAAELIGAFVRRSNAKIIVRTRGTSKSLHATPPWQVQHDWTTQSDRLGVLRQLLLRSSDEVRVNFDDTTPHRRTLVLKWEGAALELTLDQGAALGNPRTDTPSISAGPRNSRHRIF
jgi:hypothetical protein